MRVVALLAAAARARGESFGICYYKEGLDGQKNSGLTDHYFYKCDDHDPTEAALLFVAYDTDENRVGASYGPGACALVASEVAAAACLRDRCDGAAAADLPGGFFADAEGMCATPAPHSGLKTDVTVSHWELTEGRLVGLCVVLAISVVVRRRRPRYSRSLSPGPELGFSRAGPRARRLHVHGQAPPPLPVVVDLPAARLPVWKPTTGSGRPEQP